LFGAGFFYRLAVPRLKRNVAARSFYIPIEMPYAATDSPMESKLLFTLTEWHYRRLGFPNVSAHRDVLHDLSADQEWP
jgi:hypothetical protein